MPMALSVEYSGGAKIASKSLQLSRSCELDATPPEKTTGKPGYFFNASRVTETMHEQALLRFLIPLSILPFGAAAASEYGEIRSYLQDRGTPIGPLDMLIAAHARSEDMILVTNNVREFERVPDLAVENWVAYLDRI